jgi:phosphatidate cytidylyltransferase
MTLRRTCSAMIFIALIFASLFVAKLGLVLYLIVIVFALLGTYEYFSLTSLAGFRPKWALGLLLTIVILADSILTRGSNLPFIIIAALAVVVTGHLIQYSYTNLMQTTAVTMFGPLYVALPLGLGMMILRFSPFGKAMIVLLVVVVWATDSSAYLIGRELGRTKLALRLSPKKTVEGAIGGALTAIIAAVLLKHIAASLFGFLSLQMLLALSVGLTIAAQVGDLAESGFKRAAGAKDSGYSFTGHGGVLDIIDSLLFAVPILYLYMLIVHPFGHPPHVFF